MPFDARAALTALGLAHRADDILSLAREGIAMVATPAADELPVGASKIGGRPDLPPSIRWPKHGDKPLQFLCQINLEELQQACPHDWLPASGWLYFFYDGEVWGYDASHRDGFQVYLHEGAASDLKRADAPPPRPRTIIFGLIKKLEKVLEYKPCAVRYERRVNFPYWESYPIEQLGLTESEGDKYVDFLDRYDVAYPDSRTLMLTHPEALQNDPLMDCEVLARGLQDKSPEEQFADAVQKAAQDWVLLLQLQQETLNTGTWGDSATLYFCIKETDLRSKRFDNVWMSLQCH